MYTWANGQNLPSLRNCRIGHFEWSILVSRVSVRRQRPDCFVICPKTEHLTIASQTADCLSVTDWYLAVAPTWNRGDTRSSFMWEIRTFPHGPLIKIYPAPAKAGSCIERVRLFSRFSIQRQSHPPSEDRSLVLSFREPETDCD